MAALDRHWLASLERHRLCDRAGTDLRAGEILQNRDVPTGPGNRGTNPLTRVAMRLVRAVREIQAERVRAGHEQVANDGGFGGRRSNRGQDSGASHVLPSVRRVRGGRNRRPHDRIRAMLRTAADAAASLRQGAATARALVEEALGAIDRDNPRTNAFITVDADGAREAADRVDRERAGGADRGPLHGIPISLKDLIDVAGVVTTAGSHVLDDRVADATAPLVTRLLHAGAIVIGRTNLHEFALGTTSDDSAYGPVRNPLDSTRVAGGSSGGSAAAVATGMGIGSIGTDTGGSIRIPAAACGVVGLKPGIGEVSTEGVVPLSTTLDHVGPLARSVQDAAWLFDALTGALPTDVLPRGLHTVRLKRLVGYFENPLAPEVRLHLGQALARLQSVGVAISSGEVARAADAARAYADIVLAEAAHWHRTYLDTRPDRYTPRVRERLLNGRDVLAVRYLESLDARSLLREAVDEALRDCDALVLSTLPILAPPVGADTIVVDPEHPAPIPVRSAMLKHTQLFNLTGHPAISLPVATSGLPVGLQLVGHRGRTRKLLELAAACEALVASA